MRKNVLRCFGRQVDAVEAFHKTESKGKKRLNCLRIDTETEATFFRVVRTLEQAHQLAGIEFTELWLSGEESSEAVAFLKALQRTTTTIDVKVKNA